MTPARLRALRARVSAPRLAPGLLAVLSMACDTPPTAWPLTPAPPISRVPPIPRAPATPGEAPSPPVAPEPACAGDADCGYDPARDRCVADPRANRQPPLLDQGLVCYCDGARCALLRVPPVPCESDASCAVGAEPRPHPIAADAAHPHPRGRPCREFSGPGLRPWDFVTSATCERTNICTLRRLSCPRAP